MQKEFSTTQASAPTSHAYNAPGLSPLEFLRAVMDDPHLPIVSRIQAASALLPFTYPYPTPVVHGYDPCKIIIGGLGDLGPCDHGSSDHGLCDHGSSPEDPATGSTGNHSQNPISPNTTLPHDGDTQAPENLTRYSDPPSSE